MWQQTVLAASSWLLRATVWKADVDPLGDGKVLDQIQDDEDVTEYWIPAEDLSELNDNIVD